MKRSKIKDIIFYIFITAIFVFLLVAAIYSNLRIDSQREQQLKKIEDLQKQIKSLEDKKGELNKAVSQAGSKEYLEEIARKQFNLKSPGEEVVVVSKENEAEEKSNDNPEIKTENNNKKKSIWDPRNWFGWIAGK